MTDPIPLLRELAVPAETKLVLLVVDGLGGLPDPATGRTELEAAATPTLDGLAARSACGLLTPVAPGISPGSAPAHLALFGYDPLAVRIGRGVLSAVGLDVDLRPGDLAARLNFATLTDGVVRDRRAGRLPSDVSRRLCEKLQQEIRLPGAEVLVVPEMEHRAVAVFRGEGLSPALSESDPQVEGKPPRPVEPLRPEAATSAALVNRFLAEAARVLAGEERANGLLIRGFGQLPEIPSLKELYGLSAGVIAPYPMYRGLARLVGMTPHPAGPRPADAAAALAGALAVHDYVFVHVKAADAAGEDGDFARKVAVLEEVDAALGRILELDPDVLVVTGDHSTPARMSTHSWHPVPVLLHSPRARENPWVEGFSERSCLQGTLGSLRSQDLMALMLAHAGRLARFGA